MPWTKLKTIVEDGGVSAEIDKHKAKWPRFGDAWDALCWLLSRKADDLGYKKVRNGVTYRLYAQEGNSTAGTPRIVVMYSTTDDEVIIHDISASDPPAPE